MGKKSKDTRSQDDKFPLRIERIRRKTTFEKKDDSGKNIEVTMALADLHVNGRTFEITISQRKGDRTPFIPKVQLDDPVRYMGLKGTPVEDDISGNGWIRATVQPRRKLWEKLTRILVGMGVDLWKLPKEDSEEKWNPPIAYQKEEEERQEEEILTAFLAL